MSETMTMEAGTAVALVGNIGLPAAYVTEVVSDVLAKVKAAAKEQAEGLDISTAKGRDGIRSLAHKIALTKTAMDEHGKNLVADLKAQTGLIDAERRRVRDELDELKTEIRQPLTDYEEAEKERVRLHECALLEIQDVRKTGSALGLAPSAIAEAIEALAPYKARDWQEFAKRAETALSIAAEDLEFRHAAALKSEAEAAELAKLRAEAEERRKVEREKEIAAAAAEAERQAAAEVLRKEREAAAAREAEIERQRQQAELDRIAAENAVRVAAEREEERRIERNRSLIDAIKRVGQIPAQPDLASSLRTRFGTLNDLMSRKVDEDFFQEADAAVEETRKAIQAAVEAAEAREVQEAETARREAAAAEQRRQDAAIEAERKRVAKIAEDEEKARQQREQNRAHRAKINRAALAALINEGIPEEWAKAAIEAIAQAKVPAILISY